MLSVRHGTSLLAERIGALNAAMLDSELETGGALKRGMAAMNRAMMRPDNAAAAGDDYNASDGDADMASTDEVMVDLVQRNVTVMEGKYTSSGTSSSTTAATSNGASGTGSAGGTASQSGGDVGYTLSAGSGSIAKKRKSSGGRDVRREQSLGHLSAVFVQMFLANDARVVSLEEAARWLLRSNLTQPTDGSQQQRQQLSDNDEQMTPNKESPATTASYSTSAATVPSLPSDSGKAKDRSASLFKSKVRRLYDIANVLSSLKLIEKIQLIQSRRPAFRWLGAAVYPLHSTISEEAYTRDSSSKGKGDSAAKRRTPSKQEPTAAVVRVKQESGVVDSGSGDANGTQSQTLHSAFSSPGSLAAVRSQPLSFSFTKAQPAVITPTGPSLSLLAGSAQISASHSSLTPPVSATATTTLPAIPSPSLSSRHSGVYWIVNHDRSFSMEVSKMADFDPLDFAYLPYICPPGLHSIITQHQQQQQVEHKTNSASMDERPLPPHVAELSPAVQAAYVRDTAGFVSAFSAACKRWIELIPEMAPQHTHKQTNGSAKLQPKTSDTAVAASGGSGSSSGGSGSTESSSSTVPSSATASTSTRPRRGNTHSSSSSSSSSSSIR